MTEPQRADPAAYEPKTYERHGCKIQWLKSPFKDMTIMRIVGAKENIESFGEVYDDIYKDQDLLLGEPMQLSDEEWVAFWFRWIDDA